MEQTIEQKLKRVKEYLSENGISYEENHKSQRTGVLVPIYIWPYGVAIFGGSSEEIYYAVCDVYRPLFVREEETMDFILEKVRNLISERIENYYRCCQKAEQKRRNIERMNQLQEEARIRREAKRAAYEERKRREIEKVRGHRKRIVRYEKV